MSCPVFNASSRSRNVCGAFFTTKDEDSPIARLNSPCANGLEHNADMLDEPADSPASVMLFLSPPKYSALLLIHSKALIDHSYQLCDLVIHLVNQDEQNIQRHLNDM